MNEKHSLLAGLTCLADAKTRSISPKISMGKRERVAWLWKERERSAQESWDRAGRYPLPLKFPVRKPCFWLTSRAAA